MKKKCKKCGRKVRRDNIIGYCIKCKEAIIHYCIEPTCQNEVSGPDRRCQKCKSKGKNNPSYKHGNYVRGKIHYCIEPNCKNEICKEGNRCRSHAMILRFSNPEERKKVGRAGKLHPNYKRGNYCKGKKYCCIEKNCKNKVSEPDRRCHKCAHKGKNNSSWKGGLTDLYIMIRHLDEYKSWRKSVFERDNYICQKCGDNKGGNLEAHHKKQFAQILQEFLQEYSQFSPIEDKETLVRLATTYKDFWDVSNGVTLCRDCHNETKKMKCINIKRKIKNG